MSEITFSIIIPSFNYAHYLSRAISSIHQQTNSNYEILIVDDGSTDNTRHISEQLISQYPNLHYYYQENRGPAAARNLGAVKSIGRYIIFLDADDELLHEALHEYKIMIDAHPKRHVFIGEHVTQMTTGVLKKSTPQDLRIEGKEQLFAAYLFGKVSISAGAIAIHHSVFKSIKFPEELRSTEDIPFYAQLLASFDTVFIAKPLAKIHKHDDSLRHNYYHGGNVGMALVDSIFDPLVLQPKLQKFKQRYYVKRCLSLSGLAFRAGQYSHSRKWYLTAVKTDKRALLKLSRLKRFIVSFLKNDVPIKSSAKK